MNKKRESWFWIIPLMGMIFIAGGVITLVTEGVGNFRSRTESAQGTIIAKKWESYGDDSLTIVRTIRFQTNKREQIQFTSNSGSGDIGDSIDVIYDPKHPTLLVWS